MFSGLEKLFRKTCVTSEVSTECPLRFDGLLAGMTDSSRRLDRLESAVNSLCSELTAHMNSEEAEFREIIAALKTFLARTVPQ